MPPQNFDGGFNQPNFAPPAAFMPPQNFTAPQNFDGGFNQPNFAPPAAFMPPPFKDASGFPVAANDYQAGFNQPNQGESAPQFDGTAQALSFEAVGQSDGTDLQQQPPQY